MGASSIIKICAVWTVILSITMVGIAISQHNAPEGAAAMMVLGLIIIWLLGGGLLMYSFRSQISGFVSAMPLGSGTKFVLFATTLALIEEAITVSLTNMAPVFGVPAGSAYITASKNYFDVILFHSVITFIPMFIAWAWILKKYNFSPTSVLVLFGITGLVAEITINPTTALFASGSWILVYGLMVYLPAYSLTVHSTKRPTVLAYALALTIPLLCALPVAFIVNAIHPTTLHFS